MRFSSIQTEWHARGYSPIGALGNAMTALSNRDKPVIVFVNPLWILVWWWSQHSLPGSVYTARGRIPLSPREWIRVFDAEIHFPDDPVTHVNRACFTIHFDRWEMVKMAVRQTRDWLQWVGGGLRRRHQQNDGPNRFVAPLRQNVGIGSIRGSVFPWEPQGTTTSDRVAQFRVDK